MHACNCSTEGGLGLEFQVLSGQISKTVSQSEKLKKNQKTEDVAQWYSAQV